MRLEMLKINHIFALNDPQNYEQEAVVRDFEQRWRALVERVDSTIGAPARRAADADPGMLLDRFCRERFVENLLETVRHYTAALYAGGGSKKSPISKPVLPRSDPV